MNIPAANPQDLDVVVSAAPLLDALEERVLLAVATDYEQYMLELLNRARANPAAEAARLGIDLNEGLAPNTISTAAKQPLTMNQFLVDAAQGHSLWLLVNGVFDHTGINGTDPGQRMANAGYAFIPSYSWGENIAYTASTVTLNYLQAAQSLHNNLFIDSGVDGRGHRLNMMNASFREVGMGIAVGAYDPPPAGGTVYSSTMMLTQDFAYSGSSIFLTGVAYSDAVVDDDFYTPGEGYNGVTVTATRTQDGAVFQTTTIATGGYGLALPAGTYTVTATGGGLSAAITYHNVVVGAQNVKVDFVPSQGSQTYPVDQNALEDVALVLTGTNKQIILVDTTGQATGIEIVLSATNGTLTLSRLTGLDFTVRTGAGDAVMIFSGTLANVNAALNGMSFRGDADYNGPASLLIVSTAITPGGTTPLDDHTVNLTVVAVNDAPSFTKGLDQNVLEDVGLVTVPGWATDIIPGPGDEAAQTVSFAVTTNNNALFAVRPAISADGTLTYTPAANANGSAIVTVYAVDNGGVFNGGDNTSDAQTFTIDVQAVNDPPVNTVPNAQTAGEEAALVFSLLTGNRISVADVDAGVSPLRVTLTAPDGTLTLGSSAGVIVTGNGTGTLTVTGTAAALNIALNGLTFHGNAGFTGGTTLTVATNDQGATGSGGPQIDTDVINITVTAGRQLALDGRTPVRFTDASGDTILVYLIGGTGTIFLPPGDRGDIREIVLSNTTERSMLMISGGRTTVGDITVNGPMGTISASLTTLSGTLSIGPTATTYGATTILLDVLAEARVASQMPIGTFMANAWTDADATPDVLTAPRANMVYIRGQMQADLDLQGDSDRLNRNLGVFYALGAFNGNVTLAAGAGTMLLADWAAGSLQGTYVTSLISRGSLGATINLTGQNPYGASISVLSVIGQVNCPSITLAGSIGTIVAGLWNVPAFEALHAGSAIIRGNFSGAFTLTGQNAAGMSLIVLSVIGSIDNAVLRARGTINTIVAQSLIDSTIFAGVRNDLAALPSAPGAFLAPLNPARPAAINVFQISSAVGQVSNSLLAAPTLGTVILRNVQYANGAAPWGLAADETIRLLITYNTGQRPDVNYRVNASLPAVGNFEVRVV